MFCSACGAELPEGTATCPQCGKAVAAPENQNAGGSQPGSSQPLKPAGLSSQGKMESFLDFDLMITPVIMRIIYMVGSVLIALGSLFAMFSGGLLGFLLGLIGGVFALVYFRVICEILILFFKMHKDIVRIKNNTER